MLHFTILLLSLALHVIGFECKTNILVDLDFWLSIFDCNSDYVTFLCLCKRNEFSNYKRLKTSARMEVKSAIPYDPQVGFAIRWGLTAMSKEVQVHIFTKFVHWEWKMDWKAFSRKCQYNKSILANWFFFTSFVSELKLLIITGIEWCSDFCFRSNFRLNSHPGDGPPN